MALMYGDHLRQIDLHGMAAYNAREFHRYLTNIKMAFLLTGLQRKLDIGVPDGDDSDHIMGSSTPRGSGVR